MSHCKPDYKPWEQRITCCSCATPLVENQLVNDALTTNATASWAKGQLKILAEMAVDHKIPRLFIDEVNRIEAGIRLIPSGD